MTSKEQCGDDRFEIINETKEYIINATNIDTSPEEMAVLDSICFRLWQLGLTKRNKDKLDKLNDKATPKKPKDIEKQEYDELEADGSIYYYERLIGDCPNCKALWLRSNQHKYCPICGQALDWSDYND